VNDLGTELRTAAREAPDRAFLVGDGEPVTFADLDVLADRCAAGLAARGIGAGDRVAVAGLNTVDWLTLFFGAVRLGAAVVTLNVRYRETELEYMLGHSGARMLVTPADVGGFYFAAM
jgi:fatty-acyl-CoA synthase